MDKPTLTDAQIQRMFDDMQRGRIYCGIQHGRPWGKMYVQKSRIIDVNYIFWEHYGSSAEKNSLTQLRWLIDNIFNDVDGFAPGDETKYRPFYIQLLPKSEWVMKSIPA